MSAKRKESGDKPTGVGRVKLPDGKVRLFGVSAAARWLGCTHGALAQVARGVPGRGERLAIRAREEFPALFE